MNVEMIKRHESALQEIVAINDSQEKEIVASMKQIQQKLNQQ